MADSQTTCKANSPPKEFEFSISQRTDFINKEEPEEQFMEECSGKEDKVWHFGRIRLSRSFIVYIVQVIIIYLVVGVSIFNLTRQHCSQSDQKLWIATLSSAIGYLLPNPSLTK